MRRKLLSTIAALFITLAWLTETAFANVGDDISNLLRQGDTEHLVTIEDFTFFGQSVIGLDIDTAKSLMEKNGVKYISDHSDGGSTTPTGDFIPERVISGAIINSQNEYGGELQISQDTNDSYISLWGISSPPSNIEYQSPIGVKDIRLCDSLETVLRKLGFSTAKEIAHVVNGFINEERSTHEEWHEFFPNGEETLARYFDGELAFSFHAFQFEPTSIDYESYTVGYWEFSITCHTDDWYMDFSFEFDDDMLSRYSVFQMQEESFSKKPNKEKEEAVDELILPAERLVSINNSDSAIEAVSYLTNNMTATQKTDPDCIDLATLYAETAASKAATQPISGGTIRVSAASVSNLGSTAADVSEAVETALTDGGVTTARYLSKSIVFTTEEQGITVQIDPDVLTTEVDKVRVETPGYALTFKLADLAPDLTQPLIFTAKPPRAEPAASDIGAVQSLSMGDMENQVITKSIIANAAVPAVEIDMPGGKTTNPITVSLPSGSGGTTYQAVVSTDGLATASKYNPATTTMDGKINTSGTYTVKSNKKDFTDIANKSAEMQKAIRYLASKGIISGTTATTFSPDGSINRAEIATLLVKALGKLDSSATASFSDVTKDNWFYTAAASSQRHKLINGYEDNTFRGTTNISKVQIVSVSSRVLKTEMGYKEPSSPANYLVKYSDTVASWAQPEVALATKENLVVYRTDGTFSGDKAMTRGDAAIIIYRLFQRIW